MNTVIQKLQPLGTGVLRYGVAALLFLYGGYKFTRTEAETIQPLLANSPLFSWVTGILDARTVSGIIGVIEITLGLGILARRVWPRFSGFASLGASGLFLITLSFLFTTPGVTPFNAAGGFLLKDVVLLGAALFTAGEALQASLGSPQRATGASERSSLDLY